MAVQYSITAMGCMIQQRAFNLFPPQYSMAQGAGSKISGIIDSGVLKAFGSAMATYCGQNYGAKRMDRIRAGMKSAVIVGGGLVVFSIAFVVGFAYPLAQLLIPKQSKDVYDLVFQYVTTQACFYPFLAMIYIYRESLQGIGRGVLAAFGGGIELIARVVSSFTIARIAFGWACFSNPSAWVSAGLFFIIAFFIVLRKEEKKQRED